MNVCLNKTLAKIRSSKRWLTKTNQQQVIRDVRTDTSQWAYRPVDKFVKQMRKKQKRTLALLPNTLLGVYNYFKLIYTIV